MAFDFPSSPSEGQIFNAPGGPSYVFNTPVWKAVGQGQIAIISDTPPSNPANGALWYESDSGVLFIWYNDGNSSQWVQVGGNIGGGAVRYDVAQGLTQPQKSQAQQNIGNVWEWVSTTTLAAAAIWQQVDLGMARRVKLSGLLRPAANNSLTMITSTTNGATWDTGASDYVTNNLRQSGTTVIGDVQTGGALTLNATPTLVGSANEGIAFDYILDEFNKAQRAFAHGSSIYIDTTGAISSMMLSGYRSSAVPRNGVRMGMGGTITGYVTCEIMRG